MLKEQKIIVKGSSKRFRDFIYIDDVVSITTSLLNEEKSYGKIYNVGTGMKTTVEQVLNKMIKLYKKDVNLEFTEPTPGDQNGITADMSLLKKDFNFQNFTDFGKGLNKMMEWAVGHTN